MFDGFDDRRDAEAARRARSSLPSLGAIRQDVRRELGHGCSLDVKVAECQRLKDRVEPPRPVEADRAELVRMLGESAEEAAESGLVGVAEALDGHRALHGGDHPDDGRSAPGDPGDFGGGW